MSDARQDRVSRIRGVWGQFLPAINIDDDTHFFDAGGDSLAATQLVDLVGERLSKPVGLALLFEQPVFKDFCRVVLDEMDPRPARPAKFFRVHHVAGSNPLFCFGHAWRLDHQRTIYTFPGIYARIHRDQEALTDLEIESTINALADEIERVQPEGMAHLSGFCHGGWLALAVANRLRERKRCVGYVGLVDCLPREEWWQPRRLRASARKAIKRKVSAIAEAIDAVFGIHRVPVVGSRLQRLRRSNSREASIERYRRLERRLFDGDLPARLHLFLRSSNLADDVSRIAEGRWRDRLGADAVIFRVPEVDHLLMRRFGNDPTLVQWVVDSIQSFEGADVAGPRDAAGTESGRGESPTFHRRGRSPLIELMAKNTRLRFCDVSSGVPMTLDELIALTPLVDSARALAFVYLDGTLASLSSLLALWDAGQVTALFNSELDASKKQRLEHAYSPTYIVDARRSEIEGFSRSSECSALFERKGVLQDAGSLHPDLAVLLSTSGTTGDPKLVKLTHRNLVENARSISAYLPIAGEDVTPLNLPLEYSYGLSVLNSNGIAGGLIVAGVRGIADPTFWNDFRAFGMTSFAGTPDAYRLLIDIGWLDWDLPSIRYHTQAGGALGKEAVLQLMRKSHAHGYQFFVMYGQTEATARMAYLAPEHMADRPGSIGRAIPGGEFSLDPESGELLYSGPNVFGGYASSPSDLAHIEDHGLLRTGDLARQDEAGFFFLTGRAKRIVKMFGHRVNLDDIERLLSDTWREDRFLCLGLEGEMIGIVHSGAARTREEICAALAVELPVQRAKVSLVRVDGIPLSTSGKPDYAMAKSLCVQAMQ